MDNIKVIVISSVRPEPTSAGQVLLYRHLVDQPGIELEVYGTEPESLTPSSALRRLVGRLGRTPLRQFCEDFWVLWQGRWIDPQLPRTINKSQQTVVVTVAHGDGWMAARRFAGKHGLPLITFYQDWWPDIVRAHEYARRRLDRDFHQLARDSAASICISEGMRMALGSPSNASVLYPIPEIAQPELHGICQTNRVAIFKVLYFGNLGEYGPMLANALEALGEVGSVRLIVRGSKPAWPLDFIDRMQKSGHLLPFAPRNQLDEWLSEADAFLVPMVFDPGMRRRMETSFPSKLVECARFGKPLIIWGPEYCSAIKWARSENSALCVTNPDPKALREAIEQLAASPAERQRLAAAARKAAQTDFSPEKIQQQFVGVLHHVSEEFSIAEQPITLRNGR